MNPLFPLLLFCCSINGFAQTVFESTFVDEGQSFRLQIPEGFVDAEMGMVQIAAFYRTEFVDGEEVVDYTSDNITITVSEDDFDIVGYLEDSHNTNDEITEEIIVRTIQTSSGLSFLTAQGKTDKTTENPIPLFQAYTKFRGMSVLISVKDMDDRTTIERELFDEILTSFEEYETTRENTFEEFPIYEDYETTTEDMTTFTNDLFETDLFYEFLSLDPDPHLDPDFWAEWAEDWRVDYPELLSAYYYVPSSEEESQSAGAKIISCGKDTDGINVLTVLLSLQEAIPAHYIESLQKVGTVQGDNYKFVKYEVTATVETYTNQYGYTTEINKETVAILLYVLEPPTEAFMSNLESAVKGLHYKPF